MILEAFAEFLHSVPELPANQALSVWLWNRLKSAPSSAVDQVIHCEVAISLTSRGPGKSSGRGQKSGQSSGQSSGHAPGQPSIGNLGRKIRLPEDAETSIRSQTSASVEIGAEAIYYFQGASPSGVTLLNSLYEYAMSYEQQKWSRFVHKVKASDFKLPE